LTGCEFGFSTPLNLSSGTERCSFGSVALLIPAGSGGGRQGLRLLGTHDDEPQHDGQLAEHHRENPIGYPLLVLGPQYAGDTRSQIGEAVEYQPDAEDARKEP